MPLNFAWREVHPPIMDCVSIQSSSKYIIFQETPVISQLIEKVREFH